MVKTCLRHWFGIAMIVGGTARFTVAADAPTTSPTRNAHRGEYDIGDALEVKFGRTWRAARVLKAEPEKYFIHYESFGSNFDEWVGNDRIRHVGSTADPAAVRKGEDAGLDLVATEKVDAVPPQKGAKGLDGLYLQIRTVMTDGKFSEEYRHFWFRPDGSVYFGAPPGGLGKPADFALMQRVDPKNCGTYGIDEGRFLIQRNGDEKPTSEAFMIENKGAILHFGGPAAARVPGFKQGQVLEGTYEAVAGTAAAKVFAGIAPAVSFRANGTFESERLSGIDMAGKPVSAGRSNRRGTYKLDGNTLLLSYVDGKTLSMTVFPHPVKDEFPPQQLSIAGEMYKRIPAK